MKYSLTQGENHNQNIAIYPGYGQFKIPDIAPFYEGWYEEVPFVGFNYAKSMKKDRSNYGCHFFVDDYQFGRVFNSPDTYVPMLKQFKYVLAPDFSMYLDWPKAVQIYNHFRKHWCAAYWQECGVNVIPTICWSDEESFEWCFDGEPMYSVVAISSKGTQNGKDKKKGFARGFDMMMERLEPSKVLYFGKLHDGCDQYAELIQRVEDSQISRFRPKE